MSVKDAKERMQTLNEKLADKKNRQEALSNDLVSDEILKELKKQSLMIEQIRFNLNNLTWWYLYIGLTLVSVIAVIAFIGALAGGL